MCIKSSHVHRIIRLLHQAEKGAGPSSSLSVPSKTAAAAASFHRFASAAVLCVRFLLPRVAEPATGSGTRDPIVALTIASVCINSALRRFRVPISGVSPPRSTVSGLSSVAARECSCRRLAANSSAGITG